jgi:hypothetical protein
VLGRKAVDCERNEGIIEASQAAPQGIPLNDNEAKQYKLPANFVSLREMQKAALDAIMRAHNLSKQQSRTTAAFVRVYVEL